MRLTMNEEARASLRLEPSPVRGEVPMAVREELIILKNSAKEAACDFATAIEAQAEKYGVKRAALRRLVTALAGDKMVELRAEVESLSGLLGLD